MHNQIPASEIESFLKDVISFMSTSHQIISITTLTTCGSQDKERKTQEKIESLLKEVADNLGPLLALLQESTNFLKSMNINFVTLLDKF